MPLNAAAAEDKIEAAASSAHGDTGNDKVESDESSSSSSYEDDSSSSADGESTPLRCALVHPEYVDCSGIPDDATQEEVDIAIQSARLGVDPNDLSAGPLDGAAGIVRKSSCNKATFPTALFDILADPELDGIIAWLPHGRSWRLVDVDKFNEQVLSSYFNQSKYTSFIRQVNGWGFRRVQTGPEANSYYHELFLRGKSNLLKFMRRQPASATNSQGGSSAKSRKEREGSDPDFYEMAETYPLPPNSPRKAKQVEDQEGAHQSGRKKRRTASPKKKRTKARAKSKKQKSRRGTAGKKNEEVPKSRADLPSTLDGGGQSHSQIIQEETSPFPWHGADDLSFLGDGNILSTASWNDDEHAGHQTSTGPGGVASAHAGTAAAGAGTGTAAFGHEFQQQREYHSGGAFPSEPGLHIHASGSHYHQQQQHSSYSTAASSSSTLLSEPVHVDIQAGRNTGSTGNSGSSSAVRSGSGSGRSSRRNNERLSPDEMLPMLQCLFE
mmetsp:Transcript_609/g.1323  ORF Transcript_609/g.1323 Transcript_609/m.1323 type:complete len:496 (+) Transcript_609:226-1713(+)